jgi:hypothetical protein
VVVEVDRTIAEASMANASALVGAVVADLLDGRAVIGLVL